MRILQGKTNIDFMGNAKYWMPLSIVLTLAALIALPVVGLNFGLDFTGGTEAEVRFETAPDVSAVRESLARAGMPDAVVQTFGTATEVLIRIPPTPGTDGNQADQASRVMDALGADFGSGVELRGSGYVGPQVGEELAEQGILAVIYSLIGIFIYVMFRFQWRFSVGAVVATVHDIIVTLGVLSILRVNFDLTVVAALLAVIGYSLNDTVVVYDRIRENFPRLGKLAPRTVINHSINETLSRTLNTSGTTLLVLVALYFFGGEVINAFAFTLIVGIVVGTYSSIYVASVTLAVLGVSKHDLIAVEKEGAHLDTRP